MKRRKSKRVGFSLIELCILVVVFALLAAVVVPRFSQAQTESKLTELVSSLQMMRSQIELYKIQHDDQLPGQHIKGGKIVPDDFINALTVKSPIDGFGPYIASVPANPFADEQYATKIYFLDSPDPQRREIDLHGWCFNVQTGDFYACSSKMHIKY